MLFLFNYVYACCVQVVIKEKVLELLLYFTKHEDEEVKTKAIIGLGKNIILKYEFHNVCKVIVFTVYNMLPLSISR